MPVDTNCPLTSPPQGSWNTGQPTGQVAVNRGLINEDQLWSALAEQHNLRVVNLQEVKPTPEALQLVPETMANVYKVPMVVLMSCAFSARNFGECASFHRSAP